MNDTEKADSVGPESPEKIAAERVQRLNEINGRIKVIGGQRTIEGAVDLSFLELTELPDFSDLYIKDGSFDCSNNKLTSLKGSPMHVDWHFYADNNEITSLEHASPYIGSFLSCEHNNISSFDHCPKTILGSIFARRNPITSLNGVAVIDYGEITADNFNNDQYKKYLEDLKLLESMDSETAELFDKIVKTI